MAQTRDTQNSYNMLDLSGGYQSATSHLLKKKQELYDSQNATYNTIIGSAVRRPGYEQVGQTIQFGNDSLFGGVYTYGTNNRILVGINNSNNTSAGLYFLDSGGYWTNILNNAAPNTKFRGTNYMDNFYVSGETAGTYYPLTFINSSMQPSTGINVLNAPAAKFIASYAGQLYAMNVRTGGITYKDRIYVSSPATGVVTQVQTSVNGWTTQIHVDSVHYLKVGMQIDIYGGQTSNLKAQALTIVSVDKVDNLLGISGQSLNITIDDEVWISGQFGNLVTLWNTDYPTPQTSDWLRVPPGLNENPEITGWTVNNNRLFIFTKNTTLKWDGTNLIVLRSNVGCVNHETIQNIGPWVFWLHTSGIWGYNDSTGQFKLVSMAIKPTLKRINPSNYQHCAAVATDDNVYKLAVGQLMDPVLATTSTSTSSTSTSSTSSSTSSTSTSSTSTSSSQTTTTSTSSTSSSISSTSISSTSSSSSTSTSISTTTSVSTTTSTSSSTSQSTSTSISTSTSSTTTATTLPTGKQCIVICYDYNLNIWWYEVHNREHRFYFMHSMNGYRKPYFTDENGYLFRDETSFTDAGNPIQMLVQTGRTNCGTEQEKNWQGIQVDSENARGAQIQVSYDGGDWITYPNWQLSDNIQTLNWPQKLGLPKSRDIALQFVHMDNGDPPALNGFTIYFDVRESLVNELGEDR